MEHAIFSVSQVNGYLKSLMEGDSTLSALFVRGEISNYKCYPSGHHYFTLKDESAALRCVLFRREAARLRFAPQNGMKILAFGRISVFPRDGQYQMYCGELMPDGIGALSIAFEQLKEKLHREGLFDPAHKKAIPCYPERIGLITSPAGAAVRDMLRILKARWPLARILLLPVRVQGAEAPGELTGALQWINECRGADLIIIGRGGGSMEDLWAFNDELLARAIYDSQIPVISAVGHEPDVTISDFVADLRAATPSNGAELAVPDQNELKNRLSLLKSRLESAMHRQLAEEKRRLAVCKAAPALQSPLRYVEEKRLLLDFMQRRWGEAMERIVSAALSRAAKQAAQLHALSPLGVLGRGYAIARKDDGRVIASSSQLKPGDRLRLSFAKGEAVCQVLEAEQEPARQTEGAREGGPEEEEA
jgi:exodeoxyribonuclease VII large subunit